MRTDISAEARLPKLEDTILGKSIECELLIAAYNALRSYQYGNGSTELAQEIADAIGLYFSGGKE